MLAEHLRRMVRRYDIGIDRPMRFALGVPKQELFADHGKSLLPNMSFVCIGAGLDFIAGAQVRAPHWMQRWGLEWFWRAARDPQRLLYRYLLCIAALPGFLARAALVPQRR